MAYVHLSVHERFQINTLLGLGLSHAAVARHMNRARSTIMREVRRNTKEGFGYSFGWATALARQRRANARSPRLADPALWQAVLQRLRQGWSPQQAAQRLRLGAMPLHIGERTIYRHIARLRQARDPVLRLLPRCPRKRRKRRADCRDGPLFGRRPIDHRPPEAADRTQAGHWEGDTLVATQGVPAIVTFVERASRFLIARKLPTTGADTVVRASVEAFKTSGRKKRRRTITLDNGREFAGHRSIEEALKVSVYFARPHSPWQRPTVENTNGLLRDYLPKKTDLRKITQRCLNRIVRSLNDRPRKCLNWKTPAEVFRSD